MHIFQKTYNSFIQGKGEQERVFKCPSSVVCHLNMVVTLLNGEDIKVSLWLQSHNIYIEQHNLSVLSE